MKKKFSAVVALGLAFGFAFSAGCSKDPVDPPFNPADFSTAKTEDDIYTAVKYGVDEYGKYAGAMTVVMEYTSTRGTENSSSEYVTKTRTSWDPTAKVLYMNQEYTETYKEGTETQTVTGAQVIKYYKVGEQFYGYMKQTAKEGDAEAQTQETKMKITETFFDAQLANVKDNYDVEDIKEMLPDYDFTAVKSAYETVYSTQLEAQKAKDANAKATASVTATNTDNVLEAKIVTNVETTKDSKLLKSDSEWKYFAKDGKLSKYSMVETESESGTEDGQAYTKSQSTTGSCEFIYSFDQANFDSVDAGDMSTAIDNPSQGGGSYKEVKMTAVVGDWSMELTEWFSSSRTATEAFSSITSSFNNGADCSVAWYTDSACTTAVSFTEENKADFLNGKTYYGKITVEEGYATVLVESKNVDSRSEAYKIVFGNDYNSSHVQSVNGVDTVNGDATFTFNAGLSNGLKPVVSVDGVKQAETVTSLTCEADKFYVVTYTYEYTDTYERCDIFNIKVNG